MNQIHLEPNMTKIIFRDPPPNGKAFTILPGEALYNSVTGYIHILKSNDVGDPILLQLLPIKVAQIHRNRAIAKVATTIISAFGIDFFDDDNRYKVTNFFFNKAVDLSSPALADVISVMTAREEGFGYYDMKTKELIFGFAIIMPGY
ncbi:hypothetical protein [Nostoc sp.]|uniref:hypothetical protein n=1 Tax=Nostoc sp. TaxID=1180 RepID=UPI002FF6A5FF